MENTYTLKKILNILMSKIWLIIILFVVGGGVAFSVSEFLMPIKYQSYTSMYVRSNTSKDGNGVGLNDLNASKSLVSTYITVLQDDIIMEQAGQKLLEKHGADELSSDFTIKNENGKDIISANSIRSCLTMSSVNDTEVLKITAVTTNAEISAELCNIIAEISPDFLIRVVGSGSVEAIGPARVNNQPVSPNIPKNTVMGALIGLILACFIIIMIDFLDNTIKNPQTLDEKYKKPIIGEIKNFSANKKGKKHGSENERITLLDKSIPFYVTEAYKSMRTNLMFSLSTTEKKIVAVSSAGPGEGKSTTAANIAIAFAQMDCKVLLIDADMRKSTQHKIFKITNTTGFSSVISKMKKINECIRKNVATNLDVLMAGPTPPNPSELLASEKTAEVLEELSKTYDYIIIDTSPINVVSDAMCIRNSIAGIIMVAYYGKTTFDEMNDAMKKIELSGVNMFGFVLNNITLKNDGSYYYKSKYNTYGYGYGYGASEKKDSKQDDNKKIKA